MKGLQILKYLFALIIMLIGFNHAMDLLPLKKEGLVLDASALMLFLLFLVQLYQNNLSKKLADQHLEMNHLVHVNLSQEEANDMAFHEALPTLIFLLPGIAVLFIFPERPHTGGSVLLFGVLGIIRAIGMKQGKNTHLSIADDHAFIKRKHPLRIPFKGLSAVTLKYDHLYFEYDTGRVDTLPLKAIPEKDRFSVLKVLVGKLDHHQVRVPEDLRNRSTG